MQKAQHALDCQIGYEETAAEPHYAMAVACAWRSNLFEPTPGKKRKTPMHSHVWHVWLRMPRVRLAAYPMFVVSKGDAEALLLGKEGAP
jgi:hypothetical protein